MTAGSRSSNPRATARSLREQWNSLLHSVHTLESKLQESDQPKPTPRMCLLLIAAEDHRFASHPGVDPLALLRALCQTYLFASRQGGSTIAMQLVRTLTNRRERTWRRKAAEIFLALKLSARVPRTRLPAYYLWVAYYGWNMEGFPRACARLRLSPTTSTVEEDALLIARLKYPQPRRHDAAQIHRIRSRARYILEMAARRKATRLAVLPGNQKCDLS